MGPLALFTYNRLKHIMDRDPEGRAYLDTYRRSAHFLVDNEFFNTVSRIAEEYPVAEFSDKTPDEYVFVEVSDPGGIDKHTFWEIGPDNTLPGVVSMTVTLLDRRTETGFYTEHVGHWRPKTGEVGISQKVREKYPNLTLAEMVQTSEWQHTRDLAHLFSTMMELFCEPRIVKRVPHDRPTRKRAAKAVGVGVADLPTTWARVAWNIGDKTVAKKDNSDGKTGRPYHLVRGHWRDYKDRHTPKAERRPGRPGWWVWIDSHHAGNPAYGVVGHRYEPRLHPKRSTRAVIDLMASRTPEGV